MKYKKYDYPSLQILTAKTDKFKNCFIEINFREDIRKMNTASRVFLSALITYNSHMYESRRDLKIKQEELYNLSFNGTCMRVGYNVITNFSIDLIDPKFINDDNYLDNCLNFLLDNIKNPNIKKNVWNLEAYEVVKEKLHIMVDSYKESPSQYARVDFSKEFLHDTYAGDRLLNSHEQIDEITREDLVLAYKDMLENSFCEISIVGNLDMEKITKKITNAFLRPKIITEKIPLFIYNNKGKYHECIKEGKYAQTQILIGYLLDELSYKERYYVMPIFNRIFGYGGLSDKLGKYLRLENSLCYTYNSDYVIYDSYGTIYTGIKKENIDNAVFYIRKAFKEMQKKEFTTKELEAEKKQILNELKLEQDSIYGISNHMYYHYVIGTPTYEEINTGIMAVTKEDISNLTKKMHFNLLYVLKEASDGRD